MPLINYFVFVGSALLLLLIGLNWCLPQPVTEPLGSVADRPTIRIASLEQLPERVVIDTSLPTIVPPTSVLAFAERLPQETIPDAKPVATPATSTIASDVPKKQNPAKREPPKKVSVHRAAPKGPKGPKVNIESAKNDKVPASPPVTRLSLLDILKERLGQGLFKLN
jgi:hypothetical protein